MFQIIIYTNKKRFDKFDKDILEGTRIGYENKKTVKRIIETGALSKEEINGITKPFQKL